MGKMKHLLMEIQESRGNVDKIVGVDSVRSLGVGSSSADQWHLWDSDDAGDNLGQEFFETVMRQQEWENE